MPYSRASRVCRQGIVRQPILLVIVLLLVLSPIPINAVSAEAVGRFESAPQEPAAPALERSPNQITITATGFNPVAQVVMADDDVTWYNTSDVPQTVEVDDAYHVFMPVLAMSRRSSDANSTDQAASTTSPLPAAVGIITDTIAPGKSWSYVLRTLGDHRVVLHEHSDVVGRVSVRPSIHSQPPATPLPAEAKPTDSTTTVATAIPSGTPAPESTPTVTTPTQTLPPTATAAPSVSMTVSTLVPTLPPTPTATSSPATIQPTARQTQPMASASSTSASASATPTRSAAPSSTTAAATSGAGSDAGDASAIAGAAASLGNVLLNPGFELDANNDGHPDNWTPDPHVTRSNAKVHSGSYAMRHAATDNSNYTVSQTVAGIVAGRTYSFAGWVNIPATTDAFTFQLLIQWTNSSNAIIGNTVIKTYTAATPAWDQAVATAAAPSGAVSALISMAVTSLNATVYVDDFAFQVANYLVNPGFEVDANNDGRPDNWTSDARVTRSNAVVHSGSYSMRHAATDNSSYNISQAIPGLKGSNTYAFTGWVNIPSTTDTFTFQINVQWLNSSNAVIAGNVVKSYTAATAGWNKATLAMMSPVGTSSAVIKMAVTSLNAVIYVDDFSFAAGSLPVINAPSTISTNTTWKAGSVYLVSGTTVNAGVTLTVQAGVVVKFSGYADLSVAGTLTVLGTTTNPVYFTSLRDDNVGGDTNNDGTATTAAPNDWSSISVASGASATLTYAIVRYGTIYGGGGMLTSSGTLIVQNSTLTQGGNGIYASGGTLQVTNSTISNNNGDGIWTSAIAPTITGSTISNNSNVGVYAQQPPMLTLTGNTITNQPRGALTIETAGGLGLNISGNTVSGNGTNGIALNGNLTTNTTLPPITGLPYINGFYINAGVTLTLQAGVVIKSSNADVTVEGILNVQGTAANPVYFTSLRDDNVGGDTNNDGTATTAAPNDWSSISVASGASATLTYAIVRYGTIYGGGGMLTSSGTLIVQNSTLTQGGNGIYASGGTLQVTNSTISNNNGDGIWTSAIAPTITGSTISNNSNVGVYAQQPPMLTLTGNTITNQPRGALTIETAGGLGLNISGNTVSGNGTNGIALNGNLTTNTTLPPITGLPYINGFYINAGVTLTLQAGVVIKSSNADVTVEGILNVQGTAANPVYFTSLRDDNVGGDTNNDGTATTAAPNDWSSISVASGASATLTYAIVRYGTIYGGGGMLTSSGTLIVQNSTLTQGGNGIYASGGTLQVTNSTISNNNGDGIWTSAIAPTITGSTISNNSNVGVYAQQPPMLTLTGNTITNQPRGALTIETAGGLGLNISGNTVSGNGTNGIALNGNLTTNTTLPPITGLPYINGFYINAGVTLTLQAGVVIKSSNADVTVEGILNVQGTAANPVYFTSLRDDNVGGDTNNDGTATTAAPNDWSSISVASGASATLTYAIVRYGTIYGGGGMLTSSGTLIVQNSTLTQGGNGIYASGGTLQVTNSTISNNNGDGIWTSAIAPTITGSTISNNSNVGVYAQQPPMLTLTGNTITNQPRGALTIETAGGLGLNVSGNTVSGNGTNGIALNGNLTTNTTLPPITGLPYINGFYINAGVTLTLQAGVVIKSSNADVTVEGILNVQGTAANPVYFTSLRDDNVGGDTNNDGTATTAAPNDWSSISVASGASATLTYAIVRYGTIYGGGGMLTSSGTLIVQNSTLTQGGNGIYASGGTLQVTNSTISNNNGDGIWTSAIAPTITGSTISNNSNVGVYAQQPPMLTLTGNTITNQPRGALTIETAGGLGLNVSGNTVSGNGTNGIALNGNLTTNTTLPPITGLPYINGFYINAGVTLTLQAGVVIKSSNADVTVEGILNVQGTAANPVYFTSLRDDNVGGDTNNDGTATTAAPNDWSSISVASGASATLTYAIVRYGTIYGGGGMLTSSGTLIVQNSTLTQGGNGIYASGGTLQVTNSTISNNNGDGIYTNIGSVSIRNNNIFGNSSYGIYNGNPNTVIDATNNWWGADSGPAPFGSGNGINYDTCYDSLNNPYACNFHVNVAPWVGQGSGNGQSVPWNQYVAEPVNTANGNYTYAHADDTIPTRSFPLAFNRAYNSANPTTGPVGYGWTHAYNMFVTTSTVDNSAVVAYGDGRAIHFVWNGSSYVPPAGIFSSLTQAGGIYTLTEKDQTVYIFNSGGQLATVTNRNGNVTTLAYTGMNLTSVTEPGGRAFTLTYDDANRITQVGDPLGRTFGFGYNAAGDLATASDLRGKTTSYSYDGNHRLTSITDANGHTFVTNVYDANGYVIQQRDAANNLTTFSYDIVNHITTVTDALNHVNTFTYDANDRLTATSNGLNQTINYTWDANNDRTSVKDARGNTTVFSYDARGNQLTSTDPLNGVTTRTYDSQNNLLTVKDPLNRVTTNTYDVHSNLLNSTNTLNGVTSFTYYGDTNRLGLLATQTDPLGHVTTLDYDGYGDLTSVTDALNKTSTRTYDLAGHVLTITDPLNHTSTITYDAADHVLTKTEPTGAVTTFTYDAVGNLLTSTDPLNHITTRTYTIKDQLATVTDAASYVTTFTYDTVGNRTGITDGNGHLTSYSYDAANRNITSTNAVGLVTSYTYDASGNRTAVKDPLNHATTFTYDKLNRLTGVANALSQRTATAYDAVGNPLSVTDALGRLTAYAYDGLNRLTTVTDALNGVVTYTYDAAGNRLTTVDANQHTTNFTYDALNRVLTETDPLNHTWTSSYDDAGRRASTTDANGVTITYTYDGANRTTGITYPASTVALSYDGAGNRTSMVDPTGTTTYTYDSLNRPSQIAQSNGTIAYGYDAVNRTRVTLPGNLNANYTYDQADRLKSVIDWNSQTTNYTFDTADRLTKVVPQNGAVTNYTYDNANRLTKLTTTLPGASKLVSVGYTVDAVGNRTAMTEPTGVTGYTYDKLNRLTAVTYPTGAPASVGYTYDATGNRLSQTQDGAATTYNYDTADRLTSLTVGGSTTPFTWDNNGQLLSKGAQSFTWDTAGRLASLTNGATTASYSYNGDGARVAQTVNGMTTAYLQNLAGTLPSVLSEVTNGTTTRYVYGTSLLAQIGSSGTSYYHADGLGSIRGMSNSAGQSVATYSYDAFGAVRTQTGAVANSFTFTGEQNDPAAGLTFLRARYYDPAVGRFTGPDPIPAHLQSTQASDAYPYVQNNPVLLTDPSGNSPIIPEVVENITGLIGATADIGEKAGHVLKAASASALLHSVSQVSLVVDLVKYPLYEYQVHQDATKANNTVALFGLNSPQAFDSLQRLKRSLTDLIQNIPGIGPLFVPFFPTPLAEEWCERQGTCALAPNTGPTSYGK